MNLSPAGLFLSLAIGAVGAGLFLYGRKQQRIPQLVGGVVLTLYPYFVPNLWAMAAVAVVILALIWILSRAGL